MKKTSLSIIIITLFIFLPILRISAHSTLLDIEYDECSWITHNNENNEKWYIFTEVHIPHEIKTVKYYINDTNLEDGVTKWNSSGLTANQIAELQNDFISGIKKWNDVYFYYRNSNGAYEKKK